MERNSGESKVREEQWRVLSERGAVESLKSERSSGESKERGAVERNSGESKVRGTPQWRV